MPLRRSLSCAAMVVGLVVLTSFGSSIILFVLNRHSLPTSSPSSASTFSPTASSVRLRSLGTQGGYQWFATLHVVNTDPIIFHGPSELLRVDQRGSTSTMLVDPEPILALVVSTDTTRLAYQTILGKVVALPSTSTRPV